MNELVYKCRWFDLAYHAMLLAIPDGAGLSARPVMMVVSICRHEAMAKLIPSAAKWGLPGPPCLAAREDDDPRATCGLCQLVECRNGKVLVMPAGQERS